MYIYIYLFINTHTHTHTYIYIYIGRHIRSKGSGYCRRILSPRLKFIYWTRLFTFHRALIPLIEKGLDQTILSICTDK